MIESLLQIWKPLLEIIFIWPLLYYLIRFFQGTRAIQVLMGLIILAVIFNIAKLLELNTINWVLTKLFTVGVVALLIIFQPELRRALARIGQNTFTSNFFNQGGTIDELVKTCDYFSRNRIGAIMAIERDTGLKNYIESGIQIDAKVTTELLVSIFTSGTPTHDGGVIISGDRIASAGSLFPLSQKTDLSHQFGTRHRAALGLTEETDSVCIVVSEETRAISVVVYGKMTRDLDQESLKRVLTTLFKPSEKKIPFKELIDKNIHFFKERQKTK